MAFRWFPGPVLVAGPCALEADGVNLKIAGTLADLGVRLGLRVVFKGSFDKANRTQLDAPRGLGLERGLDALERVKEATRLPVLTDVHEPAQTERVARVADVIQVPAFLCRQTDLLTAVGRTGRAVNIKKGQWMAANSMAGATTKVRRAGATDVAVCERGTTFGYHDLVVDMRNLRRLGELTGAAVLFDATHAVQRPGAGADGSSGGGREDVPALLAAAAAAGADGFFLEVHPEPSHATSDRDTTWPLDGLERIVQRALAVWDAVHDDAVAHA